MLGLGKKNHRRGAERPAPTRRTRRYVVAALVSLAVVALGTTAIFAGTTPPFTIDGTVPDSGAVFFSDPSGASKEFGTDNQNTTKLNNIHSDAPDTLGYQTITPGNDLSGVWLKTAVDADGDVWLYFAFQRLASSTGQVGFEFNIAPRPSACNYGGAVLTDPPGADAATQTLIDTCNPWDNRAAGDFSLIFDVQGNSAQIYKRVFSTIPGNSTTFSLSNDLLDANVSAAALGAGGLTGEGAVNLTDTVFPANPTSCLTIANIIPYTVTGNSDQADFKDVVLVNFASTIGISNCGSIELRKVLEPASDAGKFNLFVKKGAAGVDGAVDSAVDVGHNGTTGGTPVFPGTYNVSEAAGTGTSLNDYVASAPSCVNTASNNSVVPVNGAGDLAVAVNQTIVCTITNARKPQLRVDKVLVPAGDAGLFNLQIDGNTAGTGANVGNNGTTGLQNLSAGAHTVGETAGTDTSLANYDSTISCSVNGAQATNDASVTLQNGQTGICTITNTRKPTLKLVKSVTNDNGGAATAAEWNLSATAANPNNGRNFSNAGDAGVFNAVFPSVAYTLAESTGPAGYTAGSWNCDGGSLVGDQITLAAGANATCTIVNNDNLPSLTLVKTVTNDDGGTAVATDWTLSAAGATPISGAGGATSGASFDAGQYTLSESAGPAGYTPGAWSCVGGTQDGDKVTVALGQSATCTIDNNDDPGTLIVKKVVINDDGGTKVATDFSFTVNGGGAVSFVQDGQNTLAGKNTLTVDAATYTVVEPAVAGYATTYDNCANVAVANGETETCTVTNNDDPGTLIVKKVVINDSGGTKIATNFSFTVNGGSAVSFLQDGANTLAGKNTMTVDAGTYNVVEPAVAGYATSYADCSNIVVGNGETKTCTITNNDRAATLIVIKHVINNDGGQKSALDFAMQVTGANPTPASFAGAESPGTEVTLNAGQYSVSETDDPGYAPSYSADCTGSIENGVTKTCTVTNDDKPGTLIVKKVVINDDGGAKVATDFSFTVNGGGAVSFVQDGQNTLAGKNTLMVDAATYTVVEPAVAGYATTYDNCANVAVANGETETCTVTNNDDPGMLIVKKVVINDEGGSKVATDFSFSVNGGGAVSFVQDGQNTLAGKNTLTLAAGTYDVVEPAVSGYDTSYANCSDIVVGNGETKTCTITNNDNIPPAVDVQKTVRVAGSENAFAETATAPEPGGAFQYQVVVWNKSLEAVTLTALTDTIEAIVTDLDGKGTCSVPQSLAASDGTSGGADTYTCTFELTFTGNSGASQEDVVKATVTDDENDTASDEDNATVSLTNDDSFIDVTKTANPGSLDESLVGTAVTYTVVVKNTSAVDKVTLTAAGFVDKVKLNGDPATGDVVAITNLDCNGAGEGNGLPAELDPNESITCTFSMIVSGDAGDRINDLITVTGKDDDGDDVSDSDDATVTITNVPSTITVTKTANPTAVQDSGPVTFTVVVRNDSAVDTVYIQSLTDSIYGNINGKGSCTLEDGIAEGPAGSLRILPRASYTCSFVATVSQTETDVVTASGVDDDDQPVSDDDDATVTVTKTPPPPYVPRTDITVTKAATPQVQLPQGGGTAAITYNLVVTNNGPDAAANVKVADTAPADVTFASATTGAGSCTTTATALDCTVTSLAPGASVAITINATVNATGTKTNVVIVTTSTPETNTGNNTAQALTLVVAPVTPPAPKPKPVPSSKPAVEICDVLLVTPKMLKADGKPQTVVATVKEGKKGTKGATVVLTGPGIKRTVKTNAQGIARITLRPSKPGIIKVEVRGTKTCNTQRVGVVGVFEPPVTG